MTGQTTDYVACGLRIRPSTALPLRPAPGMKLAHFVITRFCLRGRRLHGGVDGPWFGSVGPLKAPTDAVRRLGKRVRSLLP